MRYTLHLVLALSAATAPAAPPPVTAVAYTPDGQRIIAGTRGTGYVIDTSSGDVITEVKGQIQRVTAVAASASTYALASGEPGKSGVVRLYEAKDASKPTAEFLAHKDAIYALAFSPDGRTLATAGYDRVIKLWDVSAPTLPLRTLTDHSDSVYALAWHKDGQLLASGSADRTVKVWDATTGKRLYTLGDAIDWVYTVAWHPDGRRLVAGGVDKSVRVWETTRDGGKLVQSVFAHSAAVSKLWYTPDGRSLDSVGEDRVLKRWDADKLTESHTYPAQPDAVLAAALRSDGKQLAIGRYDGTLVLLDPATGKSTHTPLPIKPKPPVLTTVVPDAVQRGHPTRVVITGQWLDQVQKIQFDGEDILARIVEQTPTRLDVELVVPKDVRVGGRTVRAASPAGISNDATVFVDRFPVVRELEQSRTPQTPGRVALPATLVGSLDRAGESDAYRFDARAGQQVGVQLITADPKKLSGVLTVSDGAGHVLSESLVGSLGFVAPRVGEYTVRVSDKEYRGGVGFGYRLHVGPIPVVTSVYPLGVQRGRVTPVHVSGVNLGLAEPVSVTVSTSAEVGSRIAVPLPTTQGGQPLGSAEVVIGEFPQTVVTEDGADIPVPGTADGILSTPGQSQVVKFAARKGERLIVEVTADRIGSPLDSHLEILDANGSPVRRATLRSVAQTFVAFRDHDSQSPGIRLETWNELQVNDYLYVGSELLRIKALPKNPDDDCQFVQVNGRRVGFLGTTPTHHPQNAPIYKVEIHPPKRSFPPNGLPVFALAYRNDDGGDRYGRDSRIEFDPPESATYQVRVTDARGFGGPNFGYRVTVRPPRPDFLLAITPTDPKVWKNGGVPLTVTATRVDGFTGPIAIRFEGLTEPFTAPSTFIEAEQTMAVVTLFANGTTVTDPSPIRVIGTAEIAGRKVVREANGGTPKLIDPGDLATTTSATELTLRAGSETRLTVRVERRGDFRGRVPLEVRGLPHGVKVQDIGLNGILILPEQTEREIVLYAEPWVQPMSIPIVVSARSERKGGTEYASRGVQLHVAK